MSAARSLSLHRRIQLFCQNGSVSNEVHFEYSCGNVIWFFLAEHFWDKLYVLCRHRFRHMHVFFLFRVVPDQRKQEKAGMCFGCGAEGSPTWDVQFHDSGETLSMVNTKIMRIHKKTSSTKAKAILFCKFTLGLGSLHKHPQESYSLIRISISREQFSPAFPQRHGTKFCVTLTWKFNNQLCTVAGLASFEERDFGGAFVVTTCRRVSSDDRHCLWQNLRWRSTDRIHRSFADFFFFFSENTSLEPKKNLQAHFF